MIPKQRIVVPVLSAVLITLALAAAAQYRSHEPTPDKRLASWEQQLVLPQAVSSRISWADRRLQPSGLKKLNGIARSLAPDIAAGNEFAAVRKNAEASLTRTFAGLSRMDVSEAAFIVMSMATKDMDDDIRMIMAEIKAMTAAKQRLRDKINDINRWISEEMSKRPGSSDIQNEPASGARTPSLHARRAAPAWHTSPVIRLQYAKAPVVAPLPRRNPGLSVAELKDLQDDVEGNLDELNELSEMTSLRLQMTMDRRSKFISTLSRMMKKISSTQDALVQNIK